MQRFRTQQLNDGSTQQVRLLATEAVQQRHVLQPVRQRTPSNSAASSSQTPLDAPGPRTEYIPNETHTSLVRQGTQGNKQTESYPSGAVPSSRAPPRFRSGGVRASRQNRIAIYLSGGETVTSTSGVDCDALEGDPPPPPCSLMAFPSKAELHEELPICLIVPDEGMNHGIFSGPTEVIFISEDKMRYASLQVAQPNNGTFTTHSPQWHVAETVDVQLKSIYIATQMKVIVAKGKFSFVLSEHQPRPRLAAMVPMPRIFIVPSHGGHMAGSNQTGSPTDYLFQQHPSFGCYVYVCRRDDVEGLAMYARMVKQRFPDCCVNEKPSIAELKRCIPDMVQIVRESVCGPFFHSNLAGPKRGKVAEVSAYATSEIATNNKRPPPPPPPPPPSSFQSKKVQKPTLICEEEEGAYEEVSNISHSVRNDSSETDVLTHGGQAAPPSHLSGDFPGLENINEAYEIPHCPNSNSSVDSFGTPLRFQRKVKFPGSPCYEGQFEANINDTGSSQPIRITPGRILGMENCNAAYMSGEIPPFPRCSSAESYGTPEGVNRRCKPMNRRPRPPDWKFSSCSTDAEPNSERNSGRLSSSTDSRAFIMRKSGSFTRKVSAAPSSQEASLLLASKEERINVARKSIASDDSGIADTESCCVNRSSSDTMTQQPQSQSDAAVGKISKWHLVTDN